MEKQADLRKWFKEKWVDISRKNPDGSHPECGRDEAKLGKKGYPKCRPKAKAAQMTKKEKSYAVRAKRSKRQGVGGKPTMVPTEKPEKQTKTAMNLFDHFQNGLEKVASDLDKYRHVPLPELHNTLKGLRKQHQAASQKNIFSRLKNRSQNKALGREINALGSVLDTDPIANRQALTFYMGSDGEEDLLTPKEIYQQYQKERPEHRAQVASTLAETISDKYYDMYDSGLRGANDHGVAHADASSKLHFAQGTPKGQRLADDYMKKHFGGGHKKVAKRSKPNYADALKSHRALGYTSMPDYVMEGRKHISDHDVRGVYKLEDADFRPSTAEDIAEHMAEDAYKRVGMSRDAMAHYSAAKEKSKRKANSALNRYLPGGARRKDKHLKRAKQHQAQYNAHSKNVYTARDEARIHDAAAQAFANSKFGDPAATRKSDAYMKKHFG